MYTPSDNRTDFIEMMEILDKRLNDKGKNWRHVFKALSVLDYLLHSGSESVWNYFHDNIYIVKTLKEFQYIDDSNVDQGINVRQKAKDITALLLDETKIRQRRRMGYDMDSRGARDANDFSDEAGRQRRQQEQSQRDNEDRELEQALEESRRMAAEEDERRRRNAQHDADMERALALSREEEESRKKKDNLINLDQEATPTYGALQPQYTSFLPVQMTGFNPFFQAQMQQQYLQEQEYQRQMALQQAAQQYQYMMMQPTQPLAPQPTSFGSNNPWLQTQASSPAPAPASAPAPAPAPASEPTDTLINLDGPEEPAPAPQPRGPPRVKLSDKHAELDHLLASGEGIDTFGNTGDMRLGHSAMRLNPMIQQRTGQAAALGQSAFDSPKPTSNPFAM